MTGYITKPVIDKVKMIFNSIFELEITVRHEVSSVKSGKAAELLIDKQESLVKLIFYACNKFLSLPFILKAMLGICINKYGVLLIYALRRFKFYS